MINEVRANLGFLFDLYQANIESNDDKAAKGVAEHISIATALIALMEENELTLKGCQELLQDSLKLNDYAMAQYACEYIKVHIEYIDAMECYELN